jgi:rare lipoprotein A
MAANAELPPGLKPDLFRRFYGTPEGVPFQVAIRQTALLGCVAAALLLLSACGGHKTARSHPPPPPPTIARAPAPAETATTQPPPVPPHNAKPIYVETGLASWYGPPYNHHRGANGEIYEQNAMTAAHRTLPLNSMVRVTNLTTGHVAMVRITDRGPFVEDRIVDLSLAAAEVKLEVLSAPAPIAQGGRWCVQIGAFHSEGEARKLKQKLQDRYETANVIQFTGPTGEWVRIRPEGDDKHVAEEVASKTHVKEGGVFLVRLD